MTFQALRGTSDLLPDALVRWGSVERSSRRLASLYGYRELRTPIIEEANLFLRSVGETSDIVQKEMFRFEDRGGHDIVLRPEGTASVVRAYLENNLHKTEGFVKLFYLGPMFRAERPQAGRLRQFHQYGAEAIGSEHPWVDAEIILLCVDILKACGVGNFIVWLSTMGCRDDQIKSADALRSHIEPHRQTLCKDCQSRLDRNVFRVLDCKNPICQKIAQEAVAALPHRPGFPPSPFVLCDACAEHFDTVREALRESGVKFDDTKVFARGLDYYTRTIFEVRSSSLGAQDAVAAGGRYDHLVEELGGPSLGAVGFAAGIERILLAAESGATAVTPKRDGLYLATPQPTLVPEAFRIVQQLRGHGVRALIDFERKSLKAQLREADKAGVQFVAIFGENERQQGNITLKDLEQGSQQTVALDQFADFMSRQTHSVGCHK